MIDANSRLPNGIFEGGYTNLGDYYECKGIQVKRAQNQPLILEIHKEAFHGKYCILDVGLPKPKLRDSFAGSRSQVDVDVRNSTLQGTAYEDMLKLARVFRWSGFYNGICVPSSCSDEDIKTVLSNAISLNVTIDLYCNNHDSDRISQQQIASMILLFAMIGFVVLATILHPSKGTFLAHFDIIRNFQHLTENDSRKQALENLAFLEGVRVLLSWIVVISHVMVVGGLTFVMPIYLSKVFYYY